MTAIRAFLIALCLFPSYEARAAEEQASLETVVIDEVELQGITRFSQTDLEKVLELGPGDRFDRRRVVRTGRNLTDLYRVHGYEQIRLQTQLIRRQDPKTKSTVNVFSIQISEGWPTRVAGVKLVFDDPKWQGRLDPLVGRLGLGIGDVFDQERLANGYRVIQDEISARDFIGVKVNEAQVETVPPTGLNIDAGMIGTTARWVRLTIKVELGERVSFGFRGNTVYTNAQLHALIEEQRLLGLSRDYLVRFETRILEEYSRLGYDRAKIEIYTFERTGEQARHVTFAITEGPRVQIYQVAFDGNAVFSGQDLREKFFELASPTVARRYYAAKDVTKTAELVVEWVKSQGYLSAKVVNVARTYNLNGDRVNLLITIYEGEQTIVDRIEYKGLTVLDRGEMNRILGIDEKRPLNLYAFSEGIESIKVAYRDRGYLDIKVTNEGTDSVVMYSQENRLADIRLELDEGVQYRITKVIVVGLRKTKQKVVLRELELKEGDVAEEPKLFQSEANLRRLGIFGATTIKLEADPSRTDGKIMVVNLEEGTPGLVAGGIGIRNDLGARVFGQISYANLWGRNHTVALNAAANRRFRRFGADFCPNDIQLRENAAADYCFIEYDVSLAYAWPWFFLGETTFRPMINIDRNQYSTFDASNRSLSLGLERPLWKKHGLTGLLTYTLEFIEQFNANEATAAIDNRKLRIGSVTPALILDRRDSQLTPSKGTYTTINVEFARPEFFSQRDPFPVSYSRLQFRHDFFFPLPKGISLFMSARTGLAYNLSKPPPGDPNNPLYSIPLIKQFTLGGVGSVRGFSEQSIFTPEEIAVRGYQSYVNYRVQLDFPFTGAIHIGPFFDAANLSIDNYTYKTNHHGVGVGLHYKSPVGFVNFDVGVNPNPKLNRGVDPPEQEDSYVIHFSIGTI